MSTADRIVAALRVGPPLDDDQLADRLGVRRQQVNQAARRMAANGLISRGPGPDGKLVNFLRHPADRTGDTASFEAKVSGGRDVTRFVGLPAMREGALVTPEDLAVSGFQRHTLHVSGSVTTKKYGASLNWETLGEIPPGPGLYAFVAEPETGELRVMYVGMTTQLWHVAKGQDPTLGGRGGQRYGRPIHAGDTRKRVNAEVARLHALGFTVSHWLAPIAVPRGMDASAYVKVREAELIERWELRALGWNRR